MSDSFAAGEEDSILECEDCLSPAEAFSVVGNETRLAILEALWAADRPVAFSDLRRAVGMRDSAQFNYHLSKLTGQFVRKTDDGYDFRHAGAAVIRAVLSGTINEDPELEPFEVAGTCVDCGQGLEARYEDEAFAIACVDCDRSHGRFAFPPGGLDGRTREELMDAFNQRARHLSCLSSDGVCPECNGRMTTTVSPTEAFLGLDVRVDYECQRCRHHFAGSVGLAVLDDAEIVSFYRDHGVDLNAVPFWTLEWCTTDEYTTVESEDPLRVAVTVPQDDEELRVVCDRGLNVLETERRSRES